MLLVKVFMNAISSFFSLFVKINLSEGSVWYSKSIPNTAAPYLL